MDYADLLKSTLATANRVGLVQIVMELPSPFSFSLLNFCKDEFDLGSWSLTKLPIRVGLAIYLHFSRSSKLSVGQEASAVDS